MLLCAVCAQLTLKLHRSFQSCIMTLSFLIIINTLDDKHTFSAEDLLDNFNSTCAVILDSVAPSRTKHTKALSELWL